VQNVMILENAKELVPVWLRFISWVVETNDLPLNISREMLQSNSSLDKIKKWLTKKVLAEFWKILKDSREDYVKFWLNYGKVLKEWIHYEYDLKEEIAEVSLWKSLNTWNLISLEEYLKTSPQPSSVGGEGESKGKCNHKDWEKCECWDEHWKWCECWWNCECEHNHEEEEKGEHSWKTIYYIISKSENEAKASPYVAQFKEKWVDVLVLTDAIDSFLVQWFNEYKGAKFVSVTSNDIELEAENVKLKAEREEKSKELKPLFELIRKTIWDEKIEEVVLNDKLWNALWALRVGKNGIDPQLEKMMKAMWQQIPAQKRILELNPKNSLVDLMKKEFDKDVKSEKLNDVIKYVYWQAVLLEWWEIENIGEFVEITNKFAESGIK
jgi:molecular chaperone HtpG